MLMINGYFLNRRKIRLLALFASILLIVACSSAPKTAYSTTPHNKQNKIIQVAKSQLGKPYHYGGISPKTGFDCSGLINYSYKRVGLKVPRTTRQLYRASRPVKKKHLKAGDLVFFRINRHKISHVGLYLGNNRFIHAPSSGKRVNIANMNDKYWRKRFSRGGRI